MSLLSQASLVVVPSGYKEDVVYSVKPTDGSGDLTFTRASDGTRVNSQGLVERVPWNLLQQSNTFNTTWAALNGGAVTGGQAGYDGTNNAWLLSKTASGGFIYQTANSFNGQYTISIYAKANASTFIRLNGNAITDSSAFFNLSTGTVHTYTNCVAQIDSVGSGWYKCSITSTDALLDYVNIYPAEITGISATTGSVYIQDAQLNEGTLKPYFPTTDRQNVPRLTYEGGCPSLLLEPQRTNLALYSEEFDNAYWIKSDVTITANATASPDGTQNADNFVPTTSNVVNHRVYKPNTATTQTATYSIFIKANGHNYYALRESTTSGASIGFNLATQAVTVTYSTGGCTASNGKIEAYANGWYRISGTFSFASATAQGFGLYAASSSWTSGDVESVSWAGDGTSGAYIWGAQVEAGSYPTSYIGPTTSAAVTRVADAAYGAGTSSTFNDSEGVLCVEISALANDSTNRIISVSDGSGSNRLLIKYDNSSNLIEASLTAGGVDQAVLTHTYTIVNNAKIAFKYKANDFALWVNGTQVDTDNSGSIPSGLDTLNFDNGSGGSAFYGNAKQVLYFPTALTDAELAALTTL